VHDRVRLARGLGLGGEALDQLLVLVVDATISPVGAMAPKARSMVSWSMRGKRTASYS
jgi:hypothetical protein